MIETLTHQEATVHELVVQVFVQRQHFLKLCGLDVCPLQLRLLLLEHTKVVDTEVVIFKSAQKWGISICPLMWEYSNPPSQHQHEYPTRTMGMCSYTGCTAQTQM